MSFESFSFRMSIDDENLLDCAFTPASAAGVVRVRLQQLVRRIALCQRSNIGIQSLIIRIERIWRQILCFSALVLRCSLLFALCLHVVGIGNVAERVEHIEFNLHGRQIGDKRRFRAPKAMRNLCVETTPKKE